MSDWPDIAGAVAAAVVVGSDGVVAAAAAGWTAAAAAASAVVAVGTLETPVWPHVMATASTSGAAAWCSRTPAA